MAKEGDYPVYRARHVLQSSGSLLLRTVVGGLVTSSFEGRFTPRMAVRVKHQKQISVPTPSSPESPVVRNESHERGPHFFIHCHWNLGTEAEISCRLTVLHP